MDQYSEDAGELFDGFAINVLSKNGLVDMKVDPYYSPLKDDRILSKIEELKKKKV